MRWVLFAALAASACETTISETRLNPTPATAWRHTPNQVDVLAAGPPVRPHVDIAILTLSTGTATSTEAVEELRKYAGLIGCDTIVVTPFNRTGQMFATCSVYTR